MILRAYNINGRIEYGNQGNDRFDDSEPPRKIEPIITRVFTQDEKTFGKLNAAGDDIDVDIEKRDKSISDKRLEKKNELINLLKNQIDKEVNTVLSYYPERVIASFPVKEKEARDIDSGTITDITKAITIYTEAQIIFNSLTIEEQSLTDIQTVFNQIKDRIIVNSDLFKQIAGKAQGKMTEYLKILNDPLTDLLTYELPSNILNIQGV